MRFAQIVILVLFALGLTGCFSSVELSVPVADGRVVTAKYIRWGAQSLEGLSITGPGGWTFGLDKQKSEFELGFDAGVISAQAGGGK